MCKSDRWRSPSTPREGSRRGSAVAAPFAWAFRSSTTDTYVDPLTIDIDLETMASPIRVNLTIRDTHIKYEPQPG